MGCGKSKHDVVTGNTTKVRKPLEAESVNGKESETLKRQGSCRCRNRNDISAAVSGDPPGEINTTKQEEKEAGRDGGEKTTEGGIKPEKMETNISPPVTAIVPENVMTEERETTISPLVTATLPENVMTEEKETTTSAPVTATLPENVVTQEKETTTSPTKLSILQENVVTEEKETTISPENVVTDETVNNVNENVLPLDEQKEKIDIETVEEEEKNVEDKHDGHVDTEAPLPEAEEPNLEIQTPATTEVEETINTENDRIPATKDEDIVKVVEEKPADITKEVESS